MFKHTPKQLEAINCIANHPFSLLIGGAGSGKTITALRALLVRSFKAPSRHLVVRQRLNHVKVSVWHESMPEIVKLSSSQMEISDYEHKGELYYEFPNGSQIWLGGTDTAARLEKVLGRGLATVFIEEASQVSWEAFQMMVTRLRQKTGMTLRIIICCNPPAKSHWIYKYFILKFDPDTNKPLKNASEIGWVLMNPSDNADNLPEQTIKNLKNLTGNAYKRFWLGQFIDDTEGALFHQSNIDEHRAASATYEQLKKEINIYRTVVGVDPAGSTNEKSDLTGIVAACCGSFTRESDLHGYVIADYSIKAKPEAWARRVIQLVNDVEADAVVVETNFGGDMCESTLKAAGYLGKIIKIHAQKSKITRAEPISALYDQGKVHHLKNVEELGELENEMTGYVPPHLTEIKQDSPNRMDAVVYALQDLFSGNSHYEFYTKMNAGAMRQYRKPRRR